MAVDGTVAVAVMSDTALRVLAASKGIALKEKRAVMMEGYMNKPKGLFQVAYERGLVNTEHTKRNKVTTYTPTQRRTSRPRNARTKRRTIYCTY